MSEPTPDASTLRRLAVKFGLDPRTVAKAIRGEPVRGARTSELAADAVSEWKRLQKGRKKT